MNLGVVHVLPFRGGDWNDSASAGVFALNLNNPRANSGTDVGFRAALPLARGVCLWTAHRARG